MRRRYTTDRRMGYVWIIVPILPILAAIALSAAIAGIVVSMVPTLQQGSSPIPAVAQIIALYSLALVAIYAVLIADGFAFYFFLDRRNRHFKRQQLLFAAIPTYILAMNSLGSNEKTVRLAQLSDDSMFEEQDRPAGLWAILSLFAAPIVGLIVAYDLTQDMRRHEDRQAVYLQILPLALREAGVTPPSFAPLRPHNRDPIVYVVLTAITAGLFWVYWFYTLLKDYNEHFADQAVFEDTLLACLRPATTCAACGGSVPQDAKFCPLCGTAQPSSREIISRP